MKVKNYLAKSIWFMWLVSTANINHKTSALAKNRKLSLHWINSIPPEQNGFKNPDKKETFRSHTHKSKQKKEVIWLFQNIFFPFILFLIWKDWNIKVKQLVEFEIVCCLFYKNAY